MAKWNVGIVGYGWAAGAHIEALNQVPDVAVTAVCSSRPLDAEELSRKHGGQIAVYSQLADLLAQRAINVVSICSIPDQHAAQTIAAARAGKHIILEKPVALSWEDCRAMQQAAEKAGVRTCVCFEVRYSSQFTMTKSLIDQGLLGKLHFGEVDYYHGITPAYGQYRWNIKKDAGGSSLLSAGCHALDGLLMFMGRDVAEVTSYATKSSHPDFSSYEYPTTSVTILKFSDGALGKVASCIDALEPYYLRVHLFGSHGTLLDGRLSTQRVAGLDPNRWTDLGVKLESSGDVSEHPYLYQFKAFFSALEQGRDMPLTSLSDALATFRVIFAADRSADIGRPVKLAEL
jgi:predicted dehydrogenase